MITNYFKVCGNGFGRAQDCFPFDGLNRASQDAAWDAAKERVAWDAAKERVKDHKRARIVSFHPSLKTPLQVGINIPGSGDLS
jgi:hypothetical protein